MPFLSDFFILALCVGGKSKCGARRVGKKRDAIKTQKGGRGWIYFQ
jgi:hypothetical protein